MHFKHQQTKKSREKEVFPKMFISTIAMVARDSENFEIVKNVYLLFVSTYIRLVRLFNTILVQILIIERRKQPQTYP